MTSSEISRNLGKCRSYISAQKNRKRKGADLPYIKLQGEDFVFDKEEFLNLKEEALELNSKIISYSLYLAESRLTRDFARRYYKKLGYQSVAGFANSISRYMPTLSRVVYQDIIRKREILNALEEYTGIKRDEIEEAERWI